MRWLLWPLTGLLLGGCGLMGFGDEDEGPQPAELTEFPATLPVTRAWSADCGAGSGEAQLKLALVSDGERLFCADHEGRVAAFSIDDGRALWRVETELPVSGGPGVGAGRVVVGSANAWIAALDAADGAELWRARVSSEVLARPAIGATVVAVQTADGRLTTHDADSGQRLWYFDTSVPALSLRGTSPPLIADDQVIAGFANGKLAAFAERDGRQLWEAAIALPRGRSELDRMVDIDAPPVLRGDSLYAVAYQGRVAALASRSGTLLWAREFSSSSGLDVSRERIFIVDAEDHVWAIDRDGGASYWRQEGLQYRKLSAPAIVGDSVVVGDLEGYLHFLDTSDGRLVARLKAGSGPILGAPLVSGDTVYALMASGELVAVKVGG
jgi:outer membrane protein assembly factor BamB